MSNFYTEPFVSAGEMEFPSQPYITAQPQNHTAWGVEDYVLTVIAAGAVSYQWEVFDGESWSTITGATSENLAITIDPSMNGWRYRVLVTGADGSIVVSKAAQIAVRGVQEYTFEGAIVTFDGPAMIKSLIADINAVQSGSGDPSPNNIRPITGWDTVNVVRTGKNLFDINSVTIGLMDVYTSAGEPASSQRSGFEYHLPSGTYTLANSGTFIDYLYGNVVDANRNFVSFFRLSASSASYVSTITINEGDYILMYHGTTSALDLTGSQIQIESDSTATAYAPYTADTYPISLGSTVYGGVLEAVEGQCESTMAMVDLGTLNWVRITNYNNPLFWAVLPSDARGYTTVTESNNGSDICSVFGRLRNTSGYYNILADGNYLLASFGLSFENRIYARYDACESASDFKTAVTGQKLVYPLATPTTIQLTPTEVQTLLGTNNIWADSGDIRVTIIR